MSNTLTLLVNATLYDVESLCAQIKKFIEEGVSHADTLMIDLSQVQSVDNSFLQLLLAVKLDPSYPKGKIKIINFSFETQEKIEALHLSGWLNAQ